MKWGTDLMNIIITAVFAIAGEAQSGCTQAADFTRFVITGSKGRWQRAGLSGPTSITYTGIYHIHIYLRKIKCSII